MTRIRPLSAISYFEASFNRATQARDRSADTTDSVGSTAAGQVEQSTERLNLRFLEPPEVARLYGPGGLRASEHAPGGTGVARSVAAGTDVVLHSGGPIFAFDPVGVPKPVAPTQEDAPPSVAAPGETDDRDPSQRGGAATSTAENGRAARLGFRSALGAYARMSQDAVPAREVRAPDRAVAAYAKQVGAKQQAPVTV